MHNLDIFGSIFTFTIHQNRKFKTKFGGFLTLICFIMSLSMSLLLGKDFYYRLNPKVLQQNIILQNHQKVKIDNNNLTIAWRLEDNIGNGVKLNGVLHPKIYFHNFEMKKNQNSYQFQEVEQIRLKLTNCSDLILKPNNKLKNYINLEEWYCIDFSSMDFSIGGYWNSEFLNYFSLSLDNCETDLNLNSSVCIDPKNIKEFVEKERYISVMFPQAIFSYDDLDNPLQVVYKNFFRSIDMTLTRYDVCDFNRAILADDQGWITKNYINFTEINFMNCDLTINFKEDNDYYKNINIKLISMEFYLKKSINYSHRIFMKLQDLGAIMGGLLNLIVLFFQFLNLYLNDFERKKIYVDKLFKYSRETDNEMEKFSHFKKMNILIHQKNKNNQDNAKNKKKSKEKYEELKKNREARLGKEKSALKIRNIEMQTKDKKMSFLINDKFNNLNYDQDKNLKKNDDNEDINMKNNSTTLRSCDLLNESINKFGKHGRKEIGNDSGVTSVQDPSFEITNYDNNYLINVTRENQHMNRLHLIKSKIQKLKFKHYTDESITNDNLRYKSEIYESNNKHEGISKFSDKCPNLFLDLVKKNYLDKLQENKNLKGKNIIDQEMGNKTNQTDMKREFDFKQIISKSSHLYKDISFFKNLCFKIFKVENKNSELYKKFVTFNNGIYILNKNLDLTRYLKNLQMTRMMGKLLLNGNQRHYIKNSYKSVLDRDYDFDFDKKEKRHQHKDGKLIEYITKIGGQNYESVGKMDKILIENIFNS